MPKFAAHLGFLYGEQPFEARFEAAAQDGFQGVECIDPYMLAPHVLAGLLQDHGLEQVLINTPAGGSDLAGVRSAWAQGLRGMASLRGQRKAFRYGVELALEYAQALQCQRIHVMAGVPSSDRAGDRLVWLNNLAWAVDKAAASSSPEQPITLLLEAINPVDMPDYWLTKQAQAFDAIQEIGHPNLAMQMDFYHCQMTEGDALAQWQRYGPAGWVRHVQMAGMPGRHEPDVGTLPWQALDAARYTGWVGLEYRPRTTTRAGLEWLRSLEVK